MYGDNFRKFTTSKAQMHGDNFSKFVKFVTLDRLYPSLFRACSNSFLVVLGIHECPPYIAVRGTFASSSLIRLISGRLDQKKYLPSVQNADSPLKNYFNINQMVNSSIKDF